MTPSWTGALAGLLAGLGMVAVLAWVRARRPLPLVLRIGPFIGVPGSAEASLRRSRPRRAGRRRARAGGSTGLEPAVLGSALGLVVGAAISHGSSLVSLGLFALVGGVAGRQGGIALRRSRERTRRQTIQRQLPMLADLLSLGVTAGLTPVAALEAAAASLRGPIADDVRITVADVHAGLGTEVALRRLAQRVGLPEFDRFVDAVLLAVSMGTPLAHVVRDQAADLRVEERRVLMEVAGRKDALMLVPIVFLVLPSVLAIALYPGLQSLRLVLP